MIARFAILVMISLSISFGQGCTQANRENSLGKEDSVRKVPPPDTSRDLEIKSPAKTVPADNTTTEAADSVVPQP